MDNIHNALNSIHYSTIKNLDVRFCNKELALELMLTEDDKITFHTLTFLNCSSFLWVEKTKDNKLFDYRCCAYWELSGVTLKKVTLHTNNIWLKEYPLEYNVAIEIWDSALLIATSEMVLDERHYFIP